MKADKTQSKGSKGSRPILFRLIIRMNNGLIRLRRRVPSRNLLLLLPHCLHREGCPQNVVRSLDECRHCGQCPIAGLLNLRDAYGMVACVVGGGAQALQYTRRPEVRAVVAVACERELVRGILSAFPKPVLAVFNERPAGPCHNTIVDPARVAAALDHWLAPSGDDS